MATGFTRIDLDSEALGRDVISMEGVTPDTDIAALNARNMESFADPAYVMCKVPIEELTAIRALEAGGFRFVETQLRLTFSLTKREEVERYPFEYVQITDEEGLAPVLEIARTAFEHERTNLDPEVEDAKGWSARRYEAYVRNSLASADQRVYALTTQKAVRRWRSTPTR